MTTAETNILCYLEAAGRTSYVKICDHFNLMAKAHIDGALAMLIDRQLITVAQERRPWEYWSIRTGQKPKPTVYASMREWIHAQDTFTTAEFKAAMPAKKTRAVEYLGILAEKGEIVAAGRGQWRRNTPSEAAETRDAGAPATTDVPEAVATPEPVGDAPVVSAAQESPSPVMGPAAAFADKWSPEKIADLFTQAREESRRDVEHTWPLPHAEFRMTNGDVEIVITGSPSEVHRVVSMLDQALMA